MTTLNLPHPPKKEKKTKILASYRDEKSGVNDLNKSVVSYFHLCLYKLGTKEL